MFTLRKLLLGEKTRLFMMVVIFIVFIVFSVSIIREETELRNQILYGIVMLFFLFFFVLSEILKLLFQKGTKVLIMDCKPDVAYGWMQKLKKFDIIKGYANSILVFESLYYRDKGDTEGLKQLLDHPQFQRSASLRLVHRVNLFYLALQDNDMEKAASLHKEITDMYLVRTKKRYAARPVYSLSQIHADYYIAKGNLTKAYDALRNIKKETLNHREQTYYYMSFAKYYKLKDNSRFELMVNEAKALGPELAHVKSY